MYGCADQMFVSCGKYTITGVENADITMYAWVKLFMPLPPSSPTPGAAVRHYIVIDKTTMRSQRKRRGRRRLTGARGRARQWRSWRPRAYLPNRYVNPLHTTNYAALPNDLLRRHRRRLGPKKLPAFFCTTFYFISSIYLSRPRRHGRFVISSYLGGSPGDERYSGGAPETQEAKKYTDTGLYEEKKTRKNDSKL